MTTTKLPSENPPPKISAFQNIKKEEVNVKWNHIIQQLKANYKPSPIHQIYD